MKNKIWVYLSLAVLLFFSVSMNAIAANTSTVAPWRDDTGNIHIVAQDKKRTGKYSYKTIAVTVTRCIPGTQDMSPDGEYIVLPFDSLTGQYEETDLGNGFISSTFKINEKVFKDKIGEYYSYWLAELEGITKQQIYIKIDSIMCCCNGERQYGYIMDDGTRTGAFIGNTFWNIPNDMYCRECGGNHPPFKDGWRDNTLISSTPICALNHPNAKDGYANGNK